MAKKGKKAQGQQQGGEKKQ
jgi:hypothetical protein